MGFLALGLGLVLVIEGLALALAPSSFLEQVLRMVQQLSPDARRLAGLLAMGLGLVLVVLSRTFAG